MLRNREGTHRHFLTQMATAQGEVVGPLQIQRNPVARQITFFSEPLSVGVAYYFIRGDSGVVSLKRCE